MTKLKEQIDHELQRIYPDDNILQHILNQKPARPLPKLRLLLCTVLGGILLAVPVSAHMFGTIRETTRITDENRALLDQPDIAVSETLPTDTEQTGHAEFPMNDLKSISEATEGIIQKAEGDAFLPTTVSVIRLSFNQDEHSWDIPELLTANGFATIFAKEDGSGWYLQEGEMLSLCFQTGRTADSHEDHPERSVEIGYIADHVFCQGELLHAADISCTLTAPKTGIYYPYMINCSSGKMHIEQGSVR